MTSASLSKAPSVDVIASWRSQCVSDDFLEQTSYLDWLSVPKENPVVLWSYKWYSTCSTTHTFWSMNSGASMSSPSARLLVISVTKLGVASWASRHGYVAPSVGCRFTRRLPGGMPWDQPIVSSLIFIVHRCSHRYGLQRIPMGLWVASCLSTASARSISCDTKTAVQWARACKSPSTLSPCWRSEPQLFSLPDTLKPRNWDSEGF